MPRELLSTARPSALRLAGFLCLAGGAVAAGVGSTMRWAIVGFPGDNSGANDVPVNGTDVWEGKVVLLCVIVALVGTLAMRLAGSEAVRRGIALLLVALGIVCAGLPALDALRAEDRFGGAQGLDRIARSLAADLGLPEDAVRQQLTDEFQRQLRVDVQAAPWVTTAGGLLLVAGGALSLRWTRRRRVAPSVPGSGEPEPAGS
jgi:hypothetical protein